LPARVLRGRASQGFGDPGCHLLETFRRLTDRLRDFRCQSLLQFGDGLLDLSLEVPGDLPLRLLQRFLGAVDCCIGLVARFDEVLAALVFFGMSFGLLHHLLYIGLAQPAGCLNPDALLLAARLVLGRDVDNTVGVNVEGDLDLREASWRRRNPDQIELGEQLVVGRHLGR
jgi:NAD-specific glutamate dehydrogenase